MTVSEVKKAIIEVIVTSTETEIQVTEKTHLLKDMGLSSIEVVILLGDLENAFGIRIPVSKVRNVRTAGDLGQVVISILLEQSE